MTQIMQAIEETGSTASPLPVLEMWDADEPPEHVDSDETYPLEPVDIPRFVTHDAYCAFANGARGFVIWSLGRRDVTEERSAFIPNYHVYYQAWAEVTRQLHDWQLKKVILKGRVLGDVEATITAGEESVRFSWENAGIDLIYPSLSLRFFCYQTK